MIEEYIAKFSRLRSDTSASRWGKETLHRAPHKPFLLLAVLDLFAQGTISKNLIELTPELGEIFTTYWALLMAPDQRGNIALPFFHLQSDDFWHLIPQPGKNEFLSNARQIRSVNQLRETIIGARLDDELYNLMCVEKTRDLLRATLIESSFASEVQIKLVEQGTINIEAFYYSQKLIREAKAEKTGEETVGKEYPKSAVRDQGFRRAIVIAYDQRCAFCGIRMLTSDGHTVVEAAHIVPWSIAQNDALGNGMALCRLCHWTFDEGLFRVSPQYLVIASPQLRTNQNLPGHLQTLDKRPIIGPLDQDLWPYKDSLEWHHRNIFRRR